MEQAIFDFTEREEEPSEGEPRGEKSLDERFEDFLTACPDVYPMFVRLAKQLRDAGHEKYGSKGLVEVIRFHHATRGKDDAGFKINNSFTSRLSRKMIEEYPEYVDFFEFRKLRS